MKHWRLSGKGSHHGRILSPAGRRPHWVGWTRWRSTDRTAFVQGRSELATSLLCRLRPIGAPACRAEQEARVRWCSAGCEWEHLQYRYKVQYGLCPKVVSEDLRIRGMDFIMEAQTLSSLTLNWPTGRLFEVERGFSGKPCSEVDGAETRDTDRVSAFTGDLHQQRGSGQ